MAGRGACVAGWRAVRIRRNSGGLFQAHIACSGLIEEENQRGGVMSSDRFRPSTADSPACPITR
jgi:hypothetical protein